MAQSVVYSADLGLLLIHPAGCCCSRHITLPCSNCEVQLMTLTWQRRCCESSSVQDLVRFFLWLWSFKWCQPTGCQPAKEHGRQQLFPALTVCWDSVSEEAIHVSIIQLLYTLTLIYQPVNYSLLCYLCIWLIKALDRMSISPGCKNTQKLLIVSACIYTSGFWTYICTNPAAHHLVLCRVSVQALRQVPFSKRSCDGLGVTHPPALEKHPD